MSEHWTNYWQQGHLTSFGGGFKTNYEGELKHFWQRFADNIEEHSTILDIGTGNGALIEILQTNHNFKCIGVDKAQINKDHINSVNGDILSGVSAEQLPFKNGQFDHVISQFAIEYTNVNKSIEEVLRVLKSKNNFVFICHHPESVIIKSNQEILDTSIKIKSKLIAHLDNVATALVEGRNDLIKNNFEFIDAFIFENWGNLNGLKGSNLLAFVDFLKRNQGKEVNFVKALELFKKELELLILRLQELIDAADNLSVIVNKLKESEIELELGHIREDKSAALLACFMYAKTAKHK